MEASEKPVFRMWPELHWRLDRIDTRHAHVSLFDHGARAGEVILDRSTWDAMTHYGVRCVPEGEAAGIGTWHEVPGGFAREGA